MLNGKCLESQIQEGWKFQARQGNLVSVYLKAKRLQKFSNNIVQCYSACFICTQPLINPSTK